MKEEEPEGGKIGKIPENEIPGKSGPPPPPLLALRTYWLQLTSFGTLNSEMALMNRFFALANCSA